MKCLALLTALLLGCVAPETDEDTTAAKGTDMQITSSAFTPNGAIPARYTCDSQGEEASPPLAWSGAPAATKSFALIVDDPDAPRGTWVHWVLYDLPADTTSLPEGAAKGGLPAGTREGLNGWQRTGYGGPCPPTGRHRYFHKIYALDAALGDLGRPTKDDLEKAMEGHVLAQGELIGTYLRAGG